MYLKLLQSINDFLYKMFGASKLVINLQVYINEYRYQNDIVDEKEILLYDDGRPIVQ